ncbi:Hint domain-containing protein [uncultured Pelagimonas sp.]
MTDLTHHHILLYQHEVIVANGMPTESLYLEKLT